MEVKASGKRLRVQPRKARLVAGEIKGKHAVFALAQLRYHPSKGAQMLRKVLHSAVANAVENEKRDADSLIISKIDVDEGMRMKRMRARAQGRGNRILKRTSHITIVLEEGEPFRTDRSNAKPKPRPKFGEPAKKKGKKAETAIVEEPTPTDTEAEEAPEATIEEAPEPGIAAKEEAGAAEISEEEGKEQE